MNLTKISLSLGIPLAAVAAGFYIHSKISTLEKTNGELQEAVRALTASVETLSSSAANIQQQQVRENEINRRITSLNSSVKQLRDLVERNKTHTQANPETCNRTLATTGELLGECGEQYKDVAGKAERLKSGVIAQERHIEILEGLAGLPSGGLNGLK